MWNFASKYVAGNSSMRSKNGFRKLTHNVQEFSDDEVSSANSREEGLECPICCESFNIVENVPYVLWCGHSLCKNCILGLQWAVVKIHPLRVQLPLLISCPWCNLLSPRLVCRGNLKFPHKNYFLLWMVERMNDDKMKFHDSSGECRPVWPTKLTSKSQLSYSNTQRPQSSLPDTSPNPATSYSTLDSIHSYLQTSLLFFLELTSKFPLILIFLLIVIYAIPASAAVLVLYVLLTVLFAIPSFLILYFAYPSLDWLVREILA